MTTRSPVDCEQFSNRLADLLERDMDDSTREVMESHALGCSECGALLADLRRLRVSAASLPVLEPARDLWSGVAERIASPVVDLGPVRQATARRQRRWMRPAAAAAALVVATAGLTYVVTARVVGREYAQSVVADVPTNTTEPVSIQPETVLASVGQESPSAQLATGGSAAESSGAPVRRNASSLANSAPAVATTAPVTTLASNVYNPAIEETYGAEITRLRRIVDEHRGGLDSTTVAVIDKNLAIIDEAISQCRLALSRDPNSRVLLQNLNEALGSKVELLRTAAIISAQS